MVLDGLYQYILFSNTTTFVLGWGADVIGYETCDFSDLNLGTVILLENQLTGGNL